MPPGCLQCEYCSRYWALAPSRLSWSTPVPKWPCQLENSAAYVPHSRYALWARPFALVHVPCSFFFFCIILDTGPLRRLSWSVPVLKGPCQSCGVRASEPSCPLGETFCPGPRPFFVLHFCVTRFGLTVIDSGLVGSTDHEIERCSRDTYPESYITTYTRLRREIVKWWAGDYNVGSLSSLVYLVIYDYGGGQAT